MKDNKHSILILCVIYALFLIISIIIPIPKEGAFWAGWLGMVFFLCIMIWAYMQAFQRDETLFSKVLGWPIFKTAVTFYIIQLFVGIAIIGTNAFVKVPVWLAIIVELILLGIAMICLAVKDAVREAVTTAETKVNDNTVAWKAIRTRANAIAAETGHPDIKKLAEEIRYADPMPTSMDGQIAQMLETLSSYADAENIKKAFTLIRQRKELSKDGK